jgi:CHAD domain-containing protein
MAREIEVKLGAWPGFAVPALDGAFDGLRVEVGDARVLDAVYHDAVDLRLIRAGITLRHRQGEGGVEGTWTLKLPGGQDGPAGALVREERRVEGSFATVPAELAALLRPWLRTAELVPVARLQTLRRSSRLWFDPPPPEPVAEPEPVPEPEPGAEPVPVVPEPVPEIRPEPRVVGSIDDDEVSVLQDDRVAARFREVEVEVVEDAPVGLMDAVVDRLRAAGAGAPDPTPKLVRALGPRALAPAELRPSGIGALSSATDVLRAGIAAAVLRIVEHDEVIRADVDPEGIHQARVGTRRLRSDLRTFAPLLDTAWSEPLRDELQWLAGELGEVRDRDVLAARLRKREGELDPEYRDAVEVVVARLDRERSRALRRAVAALDSPRYLALLDRLVAAAEHPATLPEADGPAVELLPALAGRSFWKLRRAVRRVGRHPTDEALHALRIKAKRARYAADVAVPVVGAPARKYAKAMGRLQDVLGDHHDCAVAAEWLEGNLRSASRAQAFALGLLVAGQHHEAATLRKSWRSAWGAVDRPKRTRWLDQ